MVLLKEARNKSEEYKVLLHQLTQFVDEHQVIQDCLKSFVEDEWANLWIKITRNNLFQMNQETVAEEEKDEIEQAREKHRATYGG